MQEIYIPMHLDSGNRGCEGITKGTTNILESSAYHVKAYTRNMKIDRKIGYETELNELIQYGLINKVSFKIRRRLSRSIQGQQAWIIEHVYKNMLDDIKLEINKPIVLLTGGDLFCYEQSEIIWLNDYLCDKQITTVLWGCSIGEENLTSENIATLKRFSLIIARESTTADMLRKTLRLNNIFLFPDPAFVVEPVECSVPVYFKQKDIIGINLSNFVNGNVGSSTTFGKNINVLFDYIINWTDMDIMLVPHVFWKGQDDRKICTKIYNQYEKTGRVHLLDSDELNYGQIRYIISQCRFFIGARTHSMISAYSACVPALALGYSVKAEGIAKDLGLPQQLVINYKNMKSINELSEAFKYLMDHEEEIRNRLNRIMPEYKQEAYGAKAVINERLSKRSMRGGI